MPIDFLDLKDRKILFEISLNARLPVSTIAKRVGTSKQVVQYRINRMEKEGVIEGYYVVINISKLGYSYHRTFLSFRNVNPETENQIVEYCIQHPKVMWITQMDGDLDLAFLIIARNAVEFQEAYEDILNKFGQFFEEKQVSTTTEIRHFRYKFLLGVKDSEELVLGGPLGNAIIDETDYKILMELTQNARYTLLQIGTKLKIHPKVVRYRMTNMMKKGIILGYRTRINHRKLGYTHYKVNLQLTQVSKDILLQLAEYIKSMPSSIYITKAIGQTDLEFEVMVRTNQEFHDMMRYLRFKFSQHIKTYSTFIMYYEPYVSYLPVMGNFK